MNTKALLVIDLQNDMTQNYQYIIDNVNHAIAWAHAEGIHVVYIRHENLSAKTRTFKTHTRGAELVADLTIVSSNIFTKYKTNALTSTAFASFIDEHDIKEFYVSGGDAIACIKSTCFNLRKANYPVTVFTDCITSYDLRQLDAMFEYYEQKGCTLTSLKEGTL